MRADFSPLQVLLVTLADGSTATNNSRV